MNPLAFSTLGCPELSLAEVAALARRTGWTGLELRCAPDEPVHLGMDPAACAVLAGTTPLALASYVGIGAEAVSDDDCVADALAHARLAADLGIGAVRVFPRAAEPGRAADRRMVRRLNRIAEALPDGVELLLETHDSHPRGADLARVLGLVDHPRIGAIWDVLHPWRTGESVAETARILAPWLAHVQLKDVRSAEDRAPVFLGAGTVPLPEVLAELAGLDYRGWLSLEWERKWYPEAAPLEEALTRGREWLAAR